MAEEPRVKADPRLTGPRGGGERKAAFSGGFCPAFSLRKDRFIDPGKAESEVVLGPLRVGETNPSSGRLEGVGAGFVLGLNGVLFFNTDSAFKIKLVIRASSGLDPRPQRFSCFMEWIFSTGLLKKLAGNSSWRRYFLCFEAF